MILVLALAGALTATTAQGASQTLPLSWRLDGGVLLVTGLAQLATIPLAAGRPDPCPCDPADVPGFDRVSLGRNDPLGDGISTDLDVVLVAGAPLLAAWRDPGATRERVDAAFISVEAVLAASATTDLLKAAIHRPRPYAYVGTPGGPIADYDSMPSGHTTAAFAAVASLLTIDRLRRPDDPAFPYLAGGMLAGAAAVGWLRIEAGHHFPSDVLFGVVVGSAVGAGIPLLHAGGVRFLPGPRSVALSGTF